MKIDNGSVWRKWDLHIHSPFSELNNQFGDNWDTYVKELFERALANDVHAIGITDYFSIEGYKKIKTEYLSNDQKLRELFVDDKKIARIKEILILPNIEFRLKLFVGADCDRVNYHVIFSNEVDTKDIEENFLHELDFVYQGNPDAEDERWKLKIANLEALGKTLKAQHPNFKDKSDLFIGMMNAVVDDSQIAKLLVNKKSKFQDKYITCVNPDEDLSDIDWNSQDHLTRKTIVQRTHCLFASNPKTAIWGLGKKAASQQEFISEFKSIKPTIWGSDAHDFARMFCPTKDRITWIKADLTFEGLRQILFEPEDRVCIQADNPDERMPYLVLQKARFIPGSTSGKFPTATIEFNQGLNTIIGGKSSGKSLLLYHIAKTANPEAVNKVTDGKSLYDLEDDANFDFEVVWADGKINRMKESPDTRTRQITYIPQLFINNLVEANNTDNFDDLILSILHQNNEFKSHFESFSNRTRSLQNDAEAAVLAFIASYDAIKRSNESIVKLGDPKAINEQIVKIKKEISDLTQASNLTAEEVTKYQDLSQKIETARKKIAKFEEDIGNLEIFKGYVEESFLSETQTLLLDQVSALSGDLGSGPISVLDSVVDKLYKKIVPGILKASAEEFKVLESLRTQEAETRKEEQSLLAQFKPISEKIKNQEKLQRLQQSLVEQQKITEEILSLTQKKTANTALIKNKFDEIWKTRNGLSQSYEELLEKISTLGLDSISSEIKLEVKKVFSEEEFNKQFSPMVDLRTVKSIFPSNYSETKGIENVNVGDFLKDLFRKVVTGEVKLRAGNEAQDALTRIVRDYFKLRYNLIHKNDDIARMSPGKRGLVLLQLILHLSNAKDPILIDQPEDNLDNRTIYEELNIFIRSKKRLRQIIMVTHNPNLVVSADAENIIVANQSGQNQGKDNRQYLFEFVGGALENSFENDAEAGVLYKKGIREHVCEVLEGGEEAFKLRQRKYSFK